MTSVAEHAAEVIAHGFTVMPGLYSADSVATLRGRVEATYEEAGRPPVVQRGHLATKSSNVVGTDAGFVIRNLLVTGPEIAGVMLDEKLLAVLHACLGEDMRLELAGSLTSDPSRTFFKWHSHVGGISDWHWQHKKPDYPRNRAIQRISLLVYLQELSPEYGSLLVYPRKPDDPLTAPFKDSLETWEGQVATQGPVGTAVLMDETTWHAALRQTRPGLRITIGGHFAARAAPREPIDETLLGFETDVPALAKLLAHARE